MCWTALTAEDRFGEDTAQWVNSATADGYLKTLKQAPARIYTSGLGQAIAFVRAHNDPAKNERERAARNAFDDLASLVLHFMDRPTNSNDASAVLIKTIRDGDLATMMWATEEALAIITWLTRYLEGEGVGDEDEPQTPAAPDEEE